MASFDRYAWHRWLARVATLFLAAGLGACTAGRLTTDRAYSELKPKEQLPEREQRQLPENLLITIENVADAGKSYSNYVVLYINGREVAPVEKLTNMTRKYTYPLRLQHGVYDVRAEYHAVGYWREQVFDIKPDEPVKILPGQRTVLTCRLEKDFKGRPVQKDVSFRLQYEALAEVEAAAPAAVQRLTRQPRLPAATPAPMPLIEELSSKPRTPPAIEQPEQLRRLPQPAPQPWPDGQTLTLQINTTPSGADVIVDDRFMGQSPLKVTVTADQNHVVQISRPGHHEVVKVIDAKELRGQSMLQLLVKLEAVAEKQ
ncbi:MAG: PEGA domain-containing protein [candidate division KSB1 bacterium]|nr:PEGA domain-containing protein [candidate division KSB1 bacterium]MDZ7365707.1 PEGA domain-containing protein [candidate division KSB1 bacterium]MDZ7403217.1 PEGA domain-containing protein [candidate division KSB1 bacterium]